MGNLIGRTLVTVLVVALSTILFLPNILSQNLEVVFNRYVRNEKGEKVTVDPALVRDFRMDRENGLGYYFPGKECVPAASEKISADYRCILTARYITSARVNELVQAQPDLLDENRTRVMPSAIEKFFAFLGNGEYKNLKIKMGLDLQGGMRATFRADFESYLNSLSDRYQPVLAKLKRTLAKPGISEKDREEAQAQLDRINDLLLLSETRKQQLLSEAKRIIDKRLAVQNLSEPEVRVQPASYSISVDMPGVANSADVLDKIKDTVTVEYRLVDEKATDRVNRQFQNELAEIQALYRKDYVDPMDVKEIMDRIVKEAALSPEEGKIFLLWRRGQREDTPNLPREFRVLGSVVLDGDDMTNAQENPNSDSGWFDIHFVLSGPGADKFADVTTNNVGRRLAILWGDRVVSDPVIRGPIVGGNGVIQGDFTQNEAADVANVIREGALPLPLEIISVSYVGPGLGQESIVSGVISIVIGFFMVNIFMLIYYRIAGVVAIVDLFLNLLIMAAILSLLGFTMTLPGFAGIILTVGMAVDANVIMYEKMKEELREGKSASVSIESGFRSSFWTILDSNMTTLIAAIILYYNGDGPIKGFAITLFFGLLASLFTALYVSRVLFDWMLHFSDMRNFSPGWGIRRKEVTGK